MRSEKEVYDIVLNFAKTDKRIRIDVYKRQPSSRAARARWAPLPRRLPRPRLTRKRLATSTWRSKAPRFRFP